jgi:hypothetical protein
VGEVVSVVLDPREQLEDFVGGDFSHRKGLKKMEDGGKV